MPKLTSKTLYLRLLGYVKPYRRLFALSIFFTVLLALTEPMLPALLKPLLDGSFVEKDPQTIRLMPFALVGVFLLRALTSYASTMTINAVSTRVVMDLRNQIFDKLLCLPNRFYDDNPTGTVLSKVTFNVEQVAAASTEVLIVLVRDSVAVLGLVSYMLWLNWRLTLVVFLLAPIIVLIVRLISKRLRRLSHSIQSSMGEMTHVLEEAIQGNQVIKLFGGQAYESGRFREISNWVRRYHMKRVAAASISSPAGQMVMVLGLAGMLYFASIQSLNDQLSVGSFVSFIAAIVMLLSPLKKLIRINEQLQQGLAAAESVFDLVDEPSEADQGQRPIERLSGQIHFERIHFSYQGASEPALRDIDLKIATGETVALVGPSGSGKSTLASLLPRFYEQNQGRILLDGIDCREMPLAQLRNNIALVSQDVTLFNDTVEANIAYGLMRGTPRDKVLEAARAAHAIEFIEQMPDGIETLIGEDGTRLSGGQRQRLAIARALLKDAPILILDEATSALDNESERYIQEALQTLTQNRTTLIIAHRLSTIESADRILVMEQGRIIEQGDHTSLMARNGVYRTLYDTQFAS
ncbi:lipid A export permease/ATP-binding protein MsbA [Candidatus Endoriftia persephonae]|jgi:subfamily B ATP-binding cassette protein MsbA|uniref:Lipid A export ATP-binding/permease protein MsbA n=2 Tax=Gammaproteobacteria TaxID=1236 RepID=G2FJ31_9GAMM|nr:lipid A export permease/ATP-binding protein MsbA [Candidatus Endoriftia persephone]EGW53175.1 lipid A export ATP-binding/permease protein MsbA [endosymbiont of Tevnia jerichonana (vent Tica)]USF87966.1 lipid A export permease/ATP-binding protein MsbA [Candidatus Endoriftia persephone]